MPGLREQKKQRTFDETVTAASRLFRDNGYRGTTIQEIAAAAGVSPGTVYNYFGTKNAILMAVVTADTETALDAAAAAVDTTAGTAVDAVMPVVDVYVRLMASLGRETLRALFVLGVDSPQSPVLPELVSLDERVVGQLAEIIGTLGDRGLVREGVVPIAAATLVYSVVAVAIMVYLAYPRQTAEDMAQAVRRQVELAFDGIGA